MKILLIEDNALIVKGLCYALEKENYLCQKVSNLFDAKKILEQDKDYLILLDITLPDGNGFTFFKEYLSPNKIPTIFLTANDDEDMICESLDIGCEDYLTKPFSTKELLARIKRVLLRSKQKSIIQVKDIAFNLDKKIVLKNNQVVNLSSLELQLLQMLFLNLNKVVTRNMILDKIWDITGNDVDDHTITVYFKRIREKLDTNIIETIKGIGYRIDDEK